MNLPARGERLEQPPFGARQVLEAVREHRRPAPGAEIGREPRRRRGAAPRRDRASRRRSSSARYARASAARSPPRSSGSSRLASISASAPASESVNPANRDDGPKRVQGATRRRAAGRSGSRPASPRTRRGRSLPARAAKSVSNVPTVPASSAPLRPASSRSTRSTSTRFGTISHGSRSSASTKRSSSSATLPACAGPYDERETHQSIVVGAVAAALLTRAAPVAKCGEPSRVERRARRPPTRARARASRSDLGLRPRRATAVPGHRACASVAEISRLRAATCIGERDAQRRTAALLDLDAAVVTHQNRLSSHRYSSPSM